ncbi:ribosomal protein S18 acetylase RimI-like enzyme [Lysinibacillus composti]|uniref:GNAT family N-acetyltransferase n=1 Tax=Lysinibacillus composti TaxID=720633 RepID=A0A3N9UQN9_9BACI|nr:GNAT family N-acetyltransferase [Lysinibacillus composti]MBM7608569.1 ribosomal protein S18 acetylase RimI-like enzyme [Lysinibacillus composti]RQW74852.1 GNAT family N-acetyltransferase [Lysinibacillus composti]
MSLTVEKLQPQDKEGVRELLVKSYLQYQGSYTDPNFWEKYLADIKGAVEDPEVEEIFVAKYNGEIVGSASLYASSDTAYKGSQYGVNYTLLRYLAVSPNHRGLGIARSLLEVGIHYTYEKDEEYMYLFTGEIMTSAIRLYEKFGFERDAEIELNLKPNTRCYRIPSNVLVLEI